MSANLITEFCRTFNVNQISDLQIAQVGDTQRFFHQVEAYLVTVNFGDRQAAPIVGNRCAGLQRIQHIFRQLHNMRTKIWFFINGHQFCGALHNTRKHTSYS